MKVPHIPIFVLCSTSVWAQVAHWSQMFSLEMEQTGTGRALCRLCGAGSDTVGHSDEPLSILWPHAAGCSGGVTQSPLHRSSSKQAGTKEPLWILQCWVDETRELHHFRLNIFLSETGQWLSLHKEIHGKDGGGGKGWDTQVDTAEVPSSIRKTPNFL